jgi:hypothetical protein
MKRTTEKKEVIFKNPRTDERFVCEDITKTTNIDGVEFILVRKENKPQKHLMRKDSLVQVKK